MLAFAVFACSKDPPTDGNTSFPAGKLRATGNETIDDATDLGNWTSSTGGKRENETLGNPDTDTREVFNAP